jgi:hypothetical protein
LSQDLAFSHDKRVKTTGNPEKMASGVTVTEQEQVRAKLFKWDAAGTRHPLLYLTDSAMEGEAYHIDFHTITG